eukprot:TRINITY_DN14739_c0_g1_i7.p1 TRINITY_DN14739_c0_g1~~TRINITY_DN14739_c0_g1_i7.p1  ORF type:complete len:467 (-),score=144.17 TRINITY_DN14739_c0_g1_i7:89-1489(-)
MLKTLGSRYGVAALTSLRSFATDLMDLTSLDEFNFSDKTKELLRKRGFTGLTSIQREMFKPIFERKNVVGQDITGSGKTLAYILPIMEYFREQKLIPKKKSASPYTLVLVPTRELVVQTVQEFYGVMHFPKEYYVKPMFGGVTLQRVYYPPGPEIIVGTPGRVIDNIERKRLPLDNIRTFVVDEAHRMMENNFMDDLEKVYNSIKESCKALPQLVMLSATFPEFIMEQVKCFCGEDYKFINLAKDLTNRTPKTVNHFVFNVAKDKRPEMLSQLFEKYVGDSSKKVIVFANTKIGIKELFDKSKIKGSQMLYGDMKQYDRLTVFNDFRKGRINVLFATDVAARGLDIPNVDLVIQLEPPQDPDLYIHRAGRTARAGKLGMVISVWNNLREKNTLGQIEKSAGITFRELEYNEDTGEIEETDKKHSFIERSEGGRQTKSYWDSGSSSEGRKRPRYNSRKVFDDFEFKF